MAAALFCGCGKEENGGNPTCPVTEVELPASSEENPMSPGSSVTIQGRGFTANSEIWMRAITRAADVQAEITDVTATTVTFTAPEVSGEQNIVLKQDGGEWILGKMYFAEKTDNPGGDEEITILPKKIVKSVLSDDEETYTTSYAYDENGRLIQMETEPTYSSYSVAEIEYAQDKITISYNEDEFQSQTKYRIENGRVVNCIEEEEGTKWETKEYEYSNDSYLTGFIFSVTEEDMTDTYAGTLTIGKNGSLEQYSIVEKEIENGENYGTYTIDFTPNTSVPNNLNLDLLGSDYFVDVIDEMAITNAYLLGIGGTRSKYLPKQLTVTDADGESFAVKYDYQFDGEYISAIRIITDEYDSTLKLYYEE